MKGTPAQRFKRKCRYDPETGCVNWVGAVAGKDRLYGIFYDKGRKVYAHRWIYERVVGPIPPGFEIDHRCFNKGCVNPKHLQAVTHKENSRRAAKRGAWSGEKNGNSKLKASQVRTIKRLAKRGLSAAKLARRFRVGLRTIYYILDGRTWKHIKPKLKPRRGGK